MVQSVIKALHKAKRSALFIKLDISKAFDSVSWIFLLETLQALGFGQRWRDWIATLLATSSSKILLNGTPGRRIKHARGLRQGDPLSPMLFILVMDPLHRLIELAASRGLLHPILPRATTLQCSLCVDDAALFANPDRTELHHITEVLNLFGKCSGLRVNLNKTEIFPIRCDETLVAEALRDFPGKVGKFPGKYLGLPLHTRQLKRVEVQPLLDKIGGRIPGWKGKLLSMVGRETLVRTVLTAQPIYHLTVFPMQKWLLRQIDKMRRSFLWKGEEPEKVSGGHCLVNCPTTCALRIFGGLGILDLERFARALRLRWLWFRWQHVQRPWAGLTIPCDSTDRDLFHASTIVTVGKGDKVMFWHSNWLNGRAPKFIAPAPFQKSKRKNITVKQATTQNKWISQVYPIQSMEELLEFVTLWEEVNSVHRVEDSEDEIKWRWTPDGQYTAKSAYRIQFLGRRKKPHLNPIWKAWVEPKCRTFAWILLQHKILTANNLAKRGWPHDLICKLCNVAPETPTHLCLECPFTQNVWTHLTTQFGRHDLQIPPSSINGWWKRLLA
jgi:hypothetical protein